jgi:hypothetical protein
MYNLTENTIYQVRGENPITLPPGYYTYDEITRKLPAAFKVDSNTLKVKYGSGTISGGLNKLIKDGYLYVAPLCLYMYVDGIDTSKNLLDGKRSNLLSVIPNINTAAGDVLSHQPQSNYKRMHDGEINELSVTIQDERGNDYPGKFIAEILLQ